MSRLKKIPISSIIGTFVLMVTLMVFFINKEEDVVTSSIGITFIILSEIALFGATTIIQLNNKIKDKTLITSGIVSTLTIYWIGTVLIEVFLSKTLKEKIPIFFTIEILLFAIIVVINICLYAAAQKLGNKDEKTLESMKSIKKSENLAFMMKSDESLKMYSKGLDDIYEALRYSDPIGTTSYEDKIYSSLQELNEVLKNCSKRQEHIDEAEEKMIFIKNLIKQRNLEVKNIKGGEYSAQ